MKLLNEKASDAMSSILGADSRFEGKLSLDGSVRVDGIFEGTLISEGTVTLGHRGAINGDIEADHVIIGGKVVGSIVAKSRLVLEGSAIVEGDISTTSLMIGEGATFNGTCYMGSDAVAEMKRRLKETRLTIRPGDKSITLYDDEGSPMEGDDSLDDNSASIQAS